MNAQKDSWDAHCVDSWVLASSQMKVIPSIDKKMLYIRPMQFHRRQLHVFQPTKGGVRRAYGSTRSLGFRRGSIVNHKKFGICTVGGTSKNKISLHSLQTGIRLTQKASISDVTFKSFNNYFIR